MLQYSIEQQDLAGDIEDIIEIDLEISSRFNIHQTTLATHIGKCFNIKPVIVKTKTGYHNISSKIRFIGAVSDLSVGTYVYSYLSDIIKSKSDAYFEQIRYRQDRWTPSAAKKIRSDFSYGFVHGVSKNLEKLQKEKEVSHPYEVQVENALVIVKGKKIDDYINNNLGKLKNSNKKINYNRDSFGAGAAAGEKQGIFRGVNGSNNNLRIG
jgi:hypothetical protein